MRKTFVLLAAAMVMAATTVGSTVSAEELDYTFGEGVTFHSNEPTIYSILLPEDEAHPYQENQRIWQEIYNRTNVMFDPVLVPAEEYEKQVEAVLNGEELPYLIPGMMDSAGFGKLDSVIAVSDYMDCMPNFSGLVANWDMQAELMQIYREDGKFYYLPGLHEQLVGGKTLLIRQDIFEAAGVDLSAETEWTWEDFHNVLIQVQDYTKKEYIWSDQYQFLSAMNLAAATFGVTAGMTDTASGNFGDVLIFDRDQNSVSFMDTTLEFKRFLTFFHNLYEEKILDPMSFEQNSTEALKKFLQGDSYVISADTALLEDILNNQRMAEPEAKLYLMTGPIGPAGIIRTSAEKGRLNGGLMISKQMLKDYDEDELQKLLRFVDWLWYSQEGQLLTQWGIEGQSYEVDEEGYLVSLLDREALLTDSGIGMEIFCGRKDAIVQLSMMTPDEREWNQREMTYRVRRNVLPPLLADAKAKGKLEKIRGTLMKYVNEEAVSFMKGEKILESDQWTEYTETCAYKKKAFEYQDSINQILQDTEKILGYPEKK